MLLQNASKKKFKRFSQSHEMDQSEYFQPVILESLSEDHEIRNCTDDIEKEITCKIVDRNSLNLLESSSSLNEVQDNLKQINDIDSSLDALQSLLTRVISFPLSSFLIFILIDIWENNDKWGNKHAVNGENGD
jgi:hypothetical protein